MVRVFSVFNFFEQHTSTADDVVDADLLNSETIILAKANQIEIKQLANSDAGPNITFHSVDEVQKIVYSKHGNFIGTLERNDMGNNFVRVYTNWGDCDTTNPTQISARIANLVTPNLNRSGTMEMIELPFAEQPNNFSICQATGNILVTAQQYLYLYRFRQYEKKKYIDFEECPFRIEVEFQPKMAAVCENLIAICSANSFLLLKVSDIRFGNDASNSDSSISSDPSGKSDQFSGELTFERK
jgi:Hermansky-Pudlak syndrome 3